MKFLLTIIFVFYSIHSFSQKKEVKFSTNDSTLNKQASEIIKVKTNPEDSVKIELADTLGKSLLEQVNILDEVFIQSKSEFTALSLGIIQREIKPPSHYERQLYTAGDFKPIHLLSLLGGSLQVDPIINAISGRTKRLKKYIQIEKKEDNLIFLEDHFKEFMLTNLNIEEAIIGRFLSYLIENENLQYT